MYDPFIYLQNQLCTTAIPELLMSELAFDHNYYGNHQNQLNWHFGASNNK